MFLPLNVLKQHLNSLMIMSNFENAVMNAALYFAYSNFKIQGRFFHLGQSVFSANSKYWAISNTYSTDLDNLPFIIIKKYLH